MSEAHLANVVDSPMVCSAAVQPAGKSFATMLAALARAASAGAAVVGDESWVVGSVVDVVVVVDAVVVVFGFVVVDEAFLSPLAPHDAARIANAAAQPMHPSVASPHRILRRFLGPQCDISPRAPEPSKSRRVSALPRTDTRTATINYTERERKI